MSLPLAHSLSLSLSSLLSSPRSSLTSASGKRGADSILVFHALALLCRPIAVPLGNLSRGQVSKGYSILCEIQDLLNEEKAANDDTEGAPATGGASGEDEGIAAERRKSKIKALSTSFYTTIPH
eukprot:COSAG06_NODE_32761_length_500_cov_2.458853_1_plen_123_part_01